MTNFLAILVVGVINMVIGSLWYGPLFGRPWMRYMGISYKQMQEGKKKGMTKQYLIMFIATLLMAYVLSMFIVFTSSVTVLEGAMVGFWAWLGFLATTMIGSVLWEQKPLNLYWLNVFHYLVVLMIDGAILAIWA